MITRESMINVLKAGAAEITFEKANGESRTAVASLTDEAVEMVGAPRGNGNPNANPENITFVELTKTGAQWRAFKLERLIEFKEL